MDLRQLRARYVGINTTAVAGTTLIWNFLVFGPGAHIDDELTVDQGLGYMTVGIFQDPTSPASSQDPLSDWCAPFWSEQTLYGTVGNGIAFRKNPSDGVYNFTSYAVPSPDADNDGIENALDPCPYAPNVSGWDPRAALTPGMAGDQDIDGLPDECDPHPRSAESLQRRHRRQQ